MHTILIAPDSFKGTLSQFEAAEAMAEGAALALSDSGAGSDYRIRTIPVADGGEGMADVIGNALGAEHIRMECHGPQHTPINASYRFHNPSSTAYIDMAAAGGLTLVPEADRNPLYTSTYGCGEMVADALLRGARQIVLGLGGSATNDCGLSALQALGLKIFDHSGELLPAPFRGEDLPRVAGFDAAQLRERLRGISLTLPCDVDSPMCGPQGAVAVFSEQKGATQKVKVLLEGAALRLAEIFDKTAGFTVSETPGAGAAGAMAAGFMALAGATVKRGCEVVLDAVGFDLARQQSALVITGEGSADSQTLAGKICGEICRRASSAGTPVAMLAGRLRDAEALKAAGFTYARSINPAGDKENPLDPEVAAARLRTATRNLVKEHIARRHQEHISRSNHTS